MLDFIIVNGKTAGVVAALSTGELHTFHAKAADHGYRRTRAHLRGDVECLCVYGRWRGGPSCGAEFPRRHGILPVPPDGIYKLGILNTEVRGEGGSSSTAPENVSCQSTHRA